MTGPRITSVVSAAQEWHGSTHLTLVVSTDGSSENQRIDGAAMARDLRCALQHVAAQRTRPASASFAD